MRLYYFQYFVNWEKSRNEVKYLLYFILYNIKWTYAPISLIRGGGHNRTLRDAHARDTVITLIFGPQIMCRILGDFSAFDSKI